MISRPVTGRPTPAMPYQAAQLPAAKPTLRFEGESSREDSFQRQPRLSDEDFAAEEARLQQGIRKAAKEKDSVLEEKLYDDLTALYQAYDPDLVQNIIFRHAKTAEINGNLEKAERLRTRMLATKAANDRLNELEIELAGLESQGKLAEAEPLARELVAAYAKPAHKIMRMKNLARILMGQGKYEEAERVWSKRLRIQASLYADKTGPGRQFVAKLAMQAQDPHSLYDNLRTGLQEGVRLAPGHPAAEWTNKPNELCRADIQDLIDTLDGLCETAREKGDYQEAIRLKQVKIAVSEGQNGWLDFDNTTLKALDELTDLYIEDGMSDEAMPLVRVYATIFSYGGGGSFNDFNPEKMHQLAGWLKSKDTSGSARTVYQTLAKYYSHRLAQGEVDELLGFSVTCTNLAQTAKGKEAQHWQRLSRTYLEASLALSQAKIYEELRSEGGVSVTMIARNANGQEDIKRKIAMLQQYGRKYPDQVEYTEKTIALYNQLRLRLTQSLAEPETETVPEVFATFHEGLATVLILQR